MPESRLASVIVPTKRRYTAAELAVDEFESDSQSEPVIKNQKKSEEDLPKKATGNGQPAVKDEGTVTGLSYYFKKNIIETRNYPLLIKSPNTSSRQVINNVF